MKIEQEMKAIIQDLIVGTEKRIEQIFQTIEESEDDRQLIELVDKFADLLDKYYEV